MLFSIYLICGFQVKFSSNGTPRNLIDSARLISQLIIFNLGSNGTPRNLIDSAQLIIFNLGSKTEISSCVLRLWRNAYFILFYIE